MFVIGFTIYKYLRQKLTPNTPEKMPVNILFVENENLPESQVCKLLGISEVVKYSVVSELAAISDALSEKSFSHVVCNIACSENQLSYLKLINTDVPVLVICSSDSEIDLTNVNFLVVKEPLSHKILFDFIAKKSIISNATLEKYAMGDQDFIDQMKQLIIEEFEENLAKIPLYLIDKNFKAVKSNMHQLIGKFAMLEMEEAHQLSKRIDTNILKDTDKEIRNVHYVLFNVEIALRQLKCSA